MPTLVNDPVPIELEELVQRRRRLGQDLYDEVWDGVLHLNPVPAGGHAAVQQQLAELLGPLARSSGLTPTMTSNLGVLDDFRVPDWGLHRDWADRVWYGTAALAVEIVSPGDESWDKLPFYAEHGVEEVLIVDPGERQVHWLRLAGGEYHPIERSGLIDLGPAPLAERLDWPE